MVIPRSGVFETSVNTMPYGDGYLSRKLHYMYIRMRDERISNTFLLDYYSLQ